MGKYNDKENDDYLLKYNLLEIDSHDELERAVTKRSILGNDSICWMIKRALIFYTD